MATSTTTDTTFGNLFRTETIIGLFSQLRPRNQAFMRFWGMRPGDPGNEKIHGLQIGWDIMDSTRRIATVRAPETGPATAKPQVIGHVSAQALRSYEELHISTNRIAHSRPLGGNFGQPDRSGRAYVTRQRAHQMDKFFNLVEFAVSRMHRGSFQLLRSGDDWIPVDTGGQITINFQVPAGNLNQLDMTGAGDIITVSWLVDTTDILSDLFQINKADANLTGYPTRHAFVNSDFMGAVINNDSFQDVAGTANRVFTIFREDGTPVGDNMGPSTDFIVVFTAYPHIIWHVHDDLLEVNGTDTLIIEDDHVALLPERNPMIARWIDGSEFIRETVGSPEVEQFGFHGWSEPKTRPSGMGEQHWMSGLPALIVPKAVKYADVTP